MPKAFFRAVKVGTEVRCIVSPRVDKLKKFCPVFPSISVQLL